MDVICYYIPFRVFPIAAINEKEIEIEKYRILLKFNISERGDKYAYDRILSMCWSGICKSRINSELITLLMYVNGKKIYIDKNGVLKNGNKQHYISPGDFLWLYEYIERNKILK